MAKYTMILIALLFCFTMCAKTKYEETYENGQLKYTVPIKGGNFQGEAIKYNHNGKVIQTSMWKDGVKDGYTIVYDNNGKIDFRSLFRSGKELLIEDYDSLGRLQRSIEIDDSKYNGNYFEYFSDGKIYIEGQHDHGEEYGFWKKYFSNGQINGVYYLKGDSILYKKEYDDAGYIIDAFLPVKINKQDEINYSIELLITDLKDVAIGVVISSGLDQNNKPIDTLSLVKSDSSIANFVCDKKLEKLYGTIAELDGQSYGMESWSWFWYDKSKEETYYNGKKYYLDTLVLFEHWN